MGADFSKQLDNAQQMPPFSLERTRYDLDSFLGRTLHFYSVNDPRTLLYSGDDLKAAGALLERYRASSPAQRATDPSLSDETLWSARRIRESAIHPDTGEPIPAALRFSAFVPVNMIIVTATLSPLVINSFAATGCVHLVNQTYNAAINYANRNASNPVPTQRLLEGYAGAVATSLTIGLTATAMTRRAAVMGPGVAGLIRSTLPFLASAGAGFANVALMRRNELTEGVTVYDADGNPRGKSAAAGQTGIAKCAAARVLWNIPIMMVPPLIMTRLERTGPLQRNPRLKMAIEIGVITSCLLGAVSPALAIFPQRDSIEADKLEPQFRGLRDAQGRPVTRLWYNKGL
jgi:sideroflexin-5